MFLRDACHAVLLHRQHVYPTYLVILTFVPKHGWKTPFIRPKPKTLAAVIDFAAVVFVAIVNNLARWRGRRKA